jgi:hypothetical protein
LDEENDYIYSFRNSCEVLGLNSHYLRSGLLRWKESKLRKTPKVRATRVQEESPRSHGSTGEKISVEREWLRDEITTCVILVR